MTTPGKKLPLTPTGSKEAEAIAKLAPVPRSLWERLFPRSVQIRRLKEKHPYLEVNDIATLGGYPAREVKAALMSSEPAEVGKTKAAR